MAKSFFLFRVFLCEAHKSHKVSHVFSEGKGKMRTGMGDAKGTLCESCVSVKFSEPCPASRLAENKPQAQFARVF